MLDFEVKSVRTGVPSASIVSDSCLRILADSTLTFRGTLPASRLLRDGPDRLHRWHRRWQEGQWPSVNTLDDLRGFGAGIFGSRQPRHEPVEDLAGLSVHGFLAARIFSVSDSWPGPSQASTMMEFLRCALDEHSGCSPRRLRSWRDGQQTWVSGRSPRSHGTSDRRNSSSMYSSTSAAR